MRTEMQQRAEAEASTDPRVDLAVERTELALERTHLAWLRTMLTIIAACMAIDKGLEIVHTQRLLKNSALLENGHTIGISITSAGTVLLFLETIRFAKRSAQLARMKKGSFKFFSPNLILAGLVLLTGIALIYLMVTTG